MRIPSISKTRRAQRGLAIVELTITLPLLLLLMFTAVEFGRALMHYNTLTQSVRDSVRYLASEAILGSTGTIALNAGLIAEAQNLVAYGTRGVGDSSESLLPGLSPADVTITTVSADDIRVAVAYDYQPVYLVLPGFGVGADRNMGYTFQAASSMRAL
jgi:Flp pilus assembly protein TadG